ncbi:MAG: helix-turn-helix domain-containing protein [Eubacteriales bacterium]
MENIDYSYLCNVIGNIAGIPIRAYRNGQRFFYQSIVNLPVDPLSAFEKEVLAIDAHVGYFITPYFHYYGIVNSGEIKIVIGPSIQTAGNNQTLKELAFKCDVATDDVSDFITGMKSIISMPLDSIVQILCAINYVMNGEKLGLEDITIYDAEQQNLKTKLESERANQKFSADAELADEQSTPHNTLFLEETIVNFIRRGDSSALKEWLSGAPAVHGGILAADQLRQIKNTFIVTATIASRAAIRGGMDVNDALSLSDAYIQKCELLNDLEQIGNLQYHMVFDYTERVERLRHGGQPSKLVRDVSNYVQHHLSDAISTEDIAKSLFISRSHLSVRFKKETGENLVDFILREKIKEAKHLLRYTDKTCVAISDYLGFSSQSHFVKVFKKYTEKTPIEYRELHNR